MPQRQPQQIFIIDIDEREAAILAPRRIALAIIEAHGLRQQIRAVQLATINEYFTLAAHRRSAEIAARAVVRNRHANRGEGREHRRESQYLDQLWKRIKLTEPTRTDCNIGLVAHMARIRRQTDVPFVIVVHLLDELGWRQCEIAEALECEPRHIRRLLKRTVL